VADKDPLGLRAALADPPPPPPTPTLASLLFHAKIPLIFIMLEAFEILTTSGVVLWSKSYAPVGAHIVNSLINDVFIEEKVVPQNAAGVSPVFKKEKYTLKWRRNKEFSLIFVVCWKSIHSAPSYFSPRHPQVIESSHRN
jgi:hypothetical protein